jgi:hypothetical protein
MPGVNPYSGGVPLGEENRGAPATPWTGIRELQNFNAAMWTSVKDVLGSLDNSLGRIADRMGPQQLPHVPVVAKVTDSDGHEMGWSWYCLGCSQDEDEYVMHKEMALDPEIWPPGLLVIAPQLKEPGGSHG